ncbi:MAG: phosphopantothenoylcysteine decarboxylase [Candidatus Omnitrophota bacterium]
MKKVFKGRKVLVTAGPTWVAIDAVRVLSNISSGELGLMLGQEAARMGAKVDLLLGPVGPVVARRGVRVVRFSYFHELDKLIDRVLKKNKYDVVLHAAAVSDFWMSAKQWKLSSARTGLVLKLKQTPKIISKIRKMNPHAFLVMFKLESGVKDSALMRRAQQSRAASRADLVVANTYESGRYRAFVSNGSGLIAKYASKKALAKNLVSLCAKKIRKQS